MLCYVHVAYVHMRQLKHFGNILPTAHGLTAVSICGDCSLNFTVACMTCYQFFSECPDLFLTGNLEINYMGSAVVPMWLLPLQSQMSSIENVSYYMYTCAINIKNVLMDWNHQLPKLLYIVCCTAFI